MKKSIIVAAIVAALSTIVSAQEVIIENRPLGSGEPGDVNGFAVGKRVYPGMYQSIQYMPGYPTAVTIFPRVIDVQCIQTAVNVICEGYSWSPKLGPGEYLWFHPVFSGRIIENATPMGIHKKVTE